MTAREKFEARLQEVGLYHDWGIGVERPAKVLDDGTIIVFAYHLDDDRYTEDIFPSFEDLRQNEIFRKECWEEFCFHEDDKFVADLALWLSGKEKKCPLFPTDVYYPASGLELNSTEFTDDKEEPIDLEIEEAEYQAGIDENRGKLDLIINQVEVFRNHLVNMIQSELHRGHNLQPDFDPYPGWDSHHLCGYEIEQKTLVIEERHGGFISLSMYQDGYDTEYIYLNSSDFPIEVLINIYNQMK